MSMEKYVTIYAFEMLDMIKQGKTVYMLDKAIREVFCVNDMPVKYLVRVLNDDNAHKRYEIWYAEDDEE
jgi:hypothetical protein